MTGGPGPGDGASGELQALVARLQRVADDLRAADASPERLRELSDEALEVSRRITELLPEAIRDAG